MRTQPTIVQWIPVAAMVGALAAISVLATSIISSSVPGFSWVGSVWVLFISWALWFAMGAKFSRLHKYILSLTGGVLFGWLTVYVNMNIMTPLFGGAAELWALPATVFLAAFSIVMLELTSWLEVGFAHFFGFAGYFAYISGGHAGSIPAGADLVAQAMYFWILLMVGLGFGIASSTIKTVILNVEHVPFHLRKTIFDKE